MNSVLSQMKGQQILIVGDVMLDRYWWGSVDRISPEAPVPIVRMQKTSVVCGGAANVAVNVAGLGARPVLFGIKGDDAEGAALDAALEAAGILPDHIVSIPERRTTIKTRIVAHQQHVVRIDQETPDAIADEHVDRLLPQLREMAAASEAVIISDYAKGFLTERLLSDLIAACRATGTIVVVDPKGRSFGKYRGASVLTPNRREAAEACNLDENVPELVSTAGQRLLNELDLDRVLITQSEAGMTLFERGKSSFHIPAAVQETYDVTAAVDTVVATLAVALGAGFDFPTSARIANSAAGLVVQQVGTTAVDLSALEAEIAKTGYAASR